MMAGGVHQFRVVDADAVNPGQGLEPVAFFDADGAPVDVGGGEAAPTAWADVTGKPAVIAAGADQAAARNAIGAGTSSQNLATGTAAQLEAGTDTTARAWTAKAIHDEIARQIAAIPPAGA